MAYIRKISPLLGGYPTKHTRNIGNKGEDIGCTFLEGKGFIIVGRNYSKKWGELDIIAEKDNTIHFFEVKSIRISGNMANNSKSGQSIHRPEDNVHGLKAKRQRRIIETYLEDTRRGLDASFQYHVLCVYMNVNTRRARVEWLQNIII